MNDATQRFVKVACPTCAGGLRNHLLLSDYCVNEKPSEYDPGFGHTYQICRCQGCDSIRFRVFSWDETDRDPDTGDYSENEVRVYPDAEPLKRKARVDVERLPRIGRVYKETLLALNARANILCGGGLRAIVEAICIEQHMTADNLEKSIDKLVEGGLLVKAQADLLHEERYIGNEALHEINPPSMEHLELGLDIIEGLLNTIYVLPLKAAQLRGAREGKRKKIRKVGAAHQ